MTALVADASVIAKCVLPEPGTDSARRLVLGADVVLAPTHLQAECANAIWKHVHRGTLHPDRGRQAIEHLRTVPLRLCPLSDLIPDAFVIALEHDHPVYDCLYVAAAIRNDCALATADERVWRLALQAGFGPRAVLVR